MMMLIAQVLQQRNEPLKNQLSKIERIENK